jgi:hypothetical protein
LSKQQQKRSSSAINLNKIRASPPIAKQQQQQQHRASYPRSPIEFQQHHQQQPKEKPKGLKELSLQEAFNFNFNESQRTMTDEESKLRTGRNYKNLEEDIEKEKRVKNEEDRKANREKSKEYSEVSFMKWFWRTEIKKILLLFRIFKHK